MPYVAEGALARPEGMGYAGTGGAESPAPLFRAGEAYEETIEVNGHIIDGLAGVEISEDGKRLILRDIIIYPRGEDIPNRVGGARMRRWLRDVCEKARAEGFEEVQVIGQRAEHSTSANPGMNINQVIY